MIDLNDIYDLSEKKQNKTDIKLMIEHMMLLLNEKEKTALQLKYGLNNNRIHTFAEIDKIINIDTENLLLGVFRKLRSKFDSSLILELLRDE